MKYATIIRPSQSAVQVKLAKLTTMYKLINGNLHIPFNHLTPNHHDSSDGYFMQLQCRTDSYKFSFSPPLLSYGTPSPFIINSPNQFCNYINTCAL